MYKKIIFYQLNASEIIIAALSKGQLSPAPTQHCTPFPRRLDKAAQIVTAWAESSLGLVLTTTSMDMGGEGRILLSCDAFVIPLNSPGTVGKFNFLRCPTTTRSAAHQLCSCMKTPFPGWEQFQKSLNTPSFWEKLWVHSGRAWRLSQLVLHPARCLGDKAGEWKEHS